MPGPYPPSFADLVSETGTIPATAQASAEAGVDPGSDLELPSAGTMSPEISYELQTREYNSTIANIELRNIQRSQTMALMSYNKNRPKYDIPSLRHFYLPASPELLNIFDASQNDSILIGFTFSTVYMFPGAPLALAYSYYGIGGDGGPYISISNFTDNGADPAGDFWKCSASGVKRTLIKSWDGVDFCVPQEVLAYDVVFSPKNIPQAFEELEIEDDLTGVIDPDRFLTNSFWQVLKKTWLELNPDPIESDAVQALRDEYIARTVALYGNTTDFADFVQYGLVSNTRGLVVSPAGGAARLKYNEEIQVVWDAAILARLDIGNEGKRKIADWAAGASGAMERVGMLTSEYYGFAESDSPIIKPFAEYDVATLAAAFGDSEPAREGEYQVQYGELEAARLIQLFGTGGSGVLLNSIFMSMAQYLATTYLESVYTFKTVKMPQLTPAQIVPRT